ncbi:MAG: 6-phospho-3-hexuloisomerase [Desulfurococcaceae archaeon]|nr:6-phospho-3-hexuloisomerase [Sulfolobales archaeon]MDW8170188.1 6-phospho-3-hexuloisomerase [Desulfurococcaceae archaeon]
MVSGAIRTAVSEIVDFIERAMDLISDEHVDALINELIEARKRGSKVLIIGAGRTGLVGRAFAQRLLHLGYNVAVLGETIVPRIDNNDLVISLSGSGRTRLVVTATEAAKAVGARIIVITSISDSPLAKLADVLVVVPGRTKVASEEDYFARQILGIHEPLAPLGTLFEDTLMVFLDGVIVELMSKLGKTEEDLREAHANIEI